MCDVIIMVPLSILSLFYNTLLLLPSMDVDSFVYMRKSPKVDFDLLIPL
jgi:hypothetical protein